MASLIQNLVSQAIKTIQFIGRPSLYILTTTVLGITKITQVTRFITARLFSSYKKLFKKRKKRKHKKVAKKTRKPKKRKDQSYLLTLVLIFIFFITITSGLTYIFIIKDLPSIKLLVDSPPSLSTKIFDRNGTLLYQIYKDENRSLIKLQDLPKYVIDATLAAEDKNFYHHFGIDLKGITRATINNLRCSIYQISCSLQGGSTITQQLVKNTLLTPEKTFTRKIKELVLSFETEFTYSKDQILEMYLNQVGYGGTAYGIEEASWQYFGKSARDLTLSESSMLAGLPISPTTLSPFGSNPYLGKIRQQQVLESMVFAGTISEDDKVQALTTPLIFHPQGVAIHAPHFVMYVKELLVKKYGEDTVSRGGLTVITTLDLNKQNILQNEIDVELKKLSNLHVQNGAGLIIAPKSGDILAMVGSRDFFDSKHDGQVNITTQPRQPGSSIKPITYALALSRGMTPSSTIDDAPICFRSKGQPDYCPKNYDGKFHGKVTLRTALASSYNIPAVKLLNIYGINNMIELAKNMGITTWDDTSRFGLSLTLGGGEITMLDLAQAYSVFASGGTKIPLSPIISVVDSTGYILEEKSGPVGTPVLEPAIAYQISSILSDTSARAPAFGSNSILNFPGKNIAVKTGTTNNLRDNWTFGYTDNLLVATWVGNNDNTPMSSVASGITGASPIWAYTLKKIIGDATPAPFTPPQTMVKVNVACPPKYKYEYFVPGTLPKIDCRPRDASGVLLETAAATSQSQ